MFARRQISIRDFQVAACWSTFVIGLSLTFAKPSERHHLNQLLGAEYFNIAQALVDGRGYSDPFAERTGPTAWMPPIYPLLLAGLLGVLGLRAHVATAVLAATCVTLIVAGLSLYAVAQRISTVVAPWIVLVPFGAWLITFRLWYFIMPTDVWLLTGVATGILATLHAYVTDGTVSQRRWGVWGGVLALSSPALAIAALICSAVVFSRHRRLRSRVLRAWGLAALIASPWVVRNAIVFGKFIPFKPNVAFEAYQANVLDSDGIYDLTSMRQHPYGDLSQCFLYTRLGEAGFIEHYGQQFREELAAHPGNVARKAGNRALAATLAYVPSFETDSALFRSLQRVVYALPWIFFCSAVWFGGKQRRLLLALAGFIALYLAPYVAIAFYGRYVLPILPLLLIMFFAALETIVTTILAERRHARQPAMDKADSRTPG